MNKLEYTIRKYSATDSETGEIHTWWEAVDPNGYCVDVYDTWLEAIHHTIIEFNS